jgi:sugar fermentation stimulation protein A
MQLPPIRQPGTLIKRYKRFLADVLLEDGSEMTVHCPNSGSMRGCSDPGSPVIISRSENKKRKYPWTLEMVQVRGVWVGINTSMTNKIVHEALENGVINDFGPILSIRPEVKVSEKSRLDFLVRSRQGSVYIEVKNCSLVENDQAIFPDAVTTRGTRHLFELENLLGPETRAAVLFCVQRSDGVCFRPAWEIDPVYSEALYRVRDKGVLVLAYRADVQPESVSLATRLPVCKAPE